MYYETKASPTPSKTVKQVTNIMSWIVTSNKFFFSDTQMALQMKEATYNSTGTKKESVKAHPFQQSF